MMEYNGQTAYQWHKLQQQHQQMLVSTTGGMSCYTVPEGAGDDDDQLASTTTEEEFGDETPVPTPTATIGAFHPPNNGPPQLGYFVPLTPIFFRSPQFRKR